MKIFILTYLATAALGIAIQARAEGFDFGVTSDPLDEQKRNVCVQITLEDSESARIGRLVPIFEGHPDNLADTNKLDVLRWYLWKLEFLKAEKLAESLVAKDGEKSAKSPTHRPWHRKNMPRGLAGARRPL